MIHRLLVGTYTTRESEGIYAVEFDPNAMSFSGPRVAAKVANPSYLAVTPDGRYVYAVNELWEFEDRPGGGVTALTCDASGSLSVLNQEFSQGADPCHLFLHESGRFLFVSNFSAGNLAVMPLREDGSVEQASDVAQHAGRGPHPRRQAEPHVHSTLMLPGGRFLAAADLGLDLLIVYEFDPANGTLRRHSEASCAPGAGPRHVALTPHGLVLAVNELDSTVGSFIWDAAAGELRPLASASTIPGGLEEPNSAAGLVVHREGWAYASNRGHDSVVAFAISADGQLRPLGYTPSGGQKPRAITLSSDGKWLWAANQDTDAVAAFSVDEATGALSPTGASIRVPSPTWIAELPA